MEEVLLLLLGVEQQVVAVAEDAVVAADSGHGHLGGLRQVIAPVQNHRRIAGAHAVGGGAGGVGRLHHGAAAGGDDQIAGLHERLGVGDGHLAEDLDQVRGGAALDHGLPDQLHRVGGGPGGTGSGRDDDGVFALHRVHEVAKRGDIGVGGGGDAGDDAHGMGHLDDARLLVLADDAHGLLVLQIVPEGGGSVGVLADLVLVVAKTGLVHGLPGQLGSVLIDDLRSLTAKFDSYIGLGCQLLQGGSHGYHLLCKRNAQVIG